MATYTRDDIARATGRLAATMRHHPEADHSSLQRALMEAKAGYYLQTLREQYPGVTLTEEQVQDLTEVLR